MKKTRLTVTNVSINSNVFFTSIGRHKDKSSGSLTSKRPDNRQIVVVQSILNIACAVVDCVCSDCSKWI